MKKITSVLLSVLLASTLLGGCAKAGQQESVSTENQIENKDPVKTEDSIEDVKNDAIHISVAVPSGAPTLSMIKMFKEQPTLGENVEVSYESVKSPDLINARVMSSEVDIAIIPTNAASILYNKGVPYKLAASNVWGILYLVSSEDIESWEELKGKEVHTIGRGLTPDIIFKYLLSSNGIDPEKDITINYYNDAAELASNFIAGKSKIALIPEPVLSNVLIKKPDTKVLFDMQEEWARATNMASSYPQASLIIKNDLIEQNPEVVEAFLKEFEDSINWANDNPGEAGAYNEEFKTGLTVETVVKGIERSNIKFVNAKDAQEAIQSYLEVLLEYSADQVGGKLPDEDFYYKK